MASSDYEPRIIHPNPGEEVWVQSMADGTFQVGVQLNDEQFTWLELNRYQLEQYRNNINASLSET